MEDDAFAVGCAEGLLETCRLTAYQRPWWLTDPSNVFFYLQRKSFSPRYAGGLDFYLCRME